MSVFKSQRVVLSMLMGGLLAVVGCARMNSSNDGLVESYAPPKIEATWIRNGEPLIFEGHQWFAVDDVESLMDSEVYQVGEYKDVPIFVDKIDVRPYDRLFTKFAKGQFRYYERKEQ